MALTRHQGLEVASHVKGVSFLLPWALLLVLLVAQESINQIHLRLVVRFAPKDGFSLPQAFIIVMTVQLVNMRAPQDPKDALHAVLVLIPSTVARRV